MVRLRGVLAGALLSCLAVPAFAVDGVIEINQAAAAAGNITPGDAPGFPVTITQGGSYRLTGNLDVRNEPNPQNVTAIEITDVADDTTIDLNGFTIRGPNVCSPTCSMSGSGVGVVTPVGSGEDFPRAHNVTVKNGTIHGMGNRGVDIDRRSRVEHVTLIENGLQGIAVLFDSHVVDNQVQANGAGGIISSSHCLVRGNVVVGNQGFGISLLGLNHGQVTNNVVVSNTGVGMALGSATGYAGNTVSLNTGGDVTGGIQIGPNVCGGALCP